MIPDFGLLRQSLEVYPRRKRIRLLEALVVENPSAGNYEELGDLYLDEKMFGRAKECYDKAISSRADLPDRPYRRVEQGAMNESSCSEAPVNYLHYDIDPIPHADKADF